ncbi:UNVERIFIED_ORG: hypothetical protein J2Y81_002098 [Paraburkholderia sediminicola]|nr:hypothetical protein [Paraburkholderia sediminicola]
MNAIYVHLAPADDPEFVLLRTSASSNPERKPPTCVSRGELDAVLLMLLDAANSQQTEGAITC